MAKNLPQEKFQLPETQKSHLPVETTPTNEIRETEKRIGEHEPRETKARQADQGARSKYRPPSRNLPALPARDEMTVKIEKIMEAGLHDSYHRLSPIAQQEFKLKGEETALKIRELLKSTHVKVKKIFRLILDWLRILPGINKFFLEQEARIKTDRIIAMKKI